MGSTSTHRVSALDTSNSKAPINSQSKTPTTLYEREDVVRGMAVCLKPDVQNENDFDPEEQVYYEDNKDSITSNNLCGMSHEDYYKKIEKLKKAYVHAIANLEKMYKNKLHVRSEIVASEDLCENPVCCRLSSEKKSDVHLSYSTTEVDSNISQSLSELSTEDQDIGGENFTSHGRDRIQGMWDGFSVEMYTLCEKPQKLQSSNLLKAKTMKKEQKHWSPKITIPEPFQMTLREDEKKQQRVRSRSELNRENYMLKKKLEEEVECQKTFHANPVPAHTYIPLMQEIMERNEERRKFVKARNKEILMAMQKPFVFLEREEKKKEILKMQIQDLDFLVKKTKTFKAKPIPKYLHDQKIIDRIEEEELYRAIKVKVRAQEMLNSSSVPKTMLHNATLNKRKTVCYDPDKELKFKPQINAKVPDFEMLHGNFQRQLMKKKKLKLTTICEPFQLHTSHVFSKKYIDDTIADETQLKEMCWPCTSSRKQSKSHNSVTSSPLGSLGLENIRSTKTSKKKNAVGNHQRKRTKNYILELEEIQERINRRPLLLEVLAQKNARATEKYTAAQKERGMKEDFVSQHGHYVTFE